MRQSKKRLTSSTNSNLQESDISTGSVTLTLVPFTPEKAGSLAPPNEPAKGIWFSMDPKEMSEHTGLGKTVQMCDMLGEATPL